MPTIACPPSFTDLFEVKCDLAYRHIYDHYVGPNQSVYEMAVDVLLE